MGKASNDNNVTFSLTQIGDFKFAHYNPKRDQVETKSPDVLNPKQLKRFLSLDIERLTPTYKDRKTVELYYDFCVFMLHSFFAPCDVIKLKYSDIKKGEIKVKRKTGTIKTAIYSKTTFNVIPVLSETIKRINK